MTRLTYRYGKLQELINWAYFYHAWNVPQPRLPEERLRHCPACREQALKALPPDEQAGARQALALREEAESLLAEWDARGLGAEACFGLFHAYAEGDDLMVSLPDSATELRLPFLRRQHAGAEGTYLCMADFIAPKRDGTPPRERSCERWPVETTVGVFCVAASDAPDDLRSSDPYCRMMAQTLADRMAEAGAERLHMEVRRHYWGYAPDEALSVEDLLAERFQGIRPAVGYPSLPDQSLIFLLDRLMPFAQIGVSLTENGMMLPHAAVAGLMLAHPKARYFAVGDVADDQLTSYAARRGLPAETLRKFLPRR